MSYYKKKVYLHLVVTEELRDLLLAQSKKEYTNISALVRSILRKYLNKKNEEII